MATTSVNTATWCRRLHSANVPLLTYYGEQRIELSGPVVARWVAKIDNLLSAEFPFGGSTFEIRLHPSWQRLLWEQACWLRGWRSNEKIGESDPAADADLVVSADLAELTAAVDCGQVAVAQTLTPLAFEWPGDLPFGVVDAAAELLSQADVPLSPTEQSPKWTQKTNLLGALASGPADELRGRRVLLGARNPETVAKQALQLWWAGASALVIDDDDPNVIARICAQENVDYALPGV